MSFVKFVVLWRMLKFVVPCCRAWRSKLCDCEVIVHMEPRADSRTAHDVRRSGFAARAFGSWLFVTFRDLIMQHKTTKCTML